MWYLQNVMGMVSRIALSPSDIFFFGAIKATKVTSSKKQQWLLKRLRDAIYIQNTSLAYICTRHDSVSYCHSGASVGASIGCIFARGERAENIGRSQHEPLGRRDSTG
jgi:hypothetical protein